MIKYAGRYFKERNRNLPTEKRIAPPEEYPEFSANGELPP
jgi:hypothetical protein